MDKQGQTSTCTKKKPRKKHQGSRSKATQTYQVKTSEENIDKKSGMSSSANGFKKPGSLSNPRRGNSKTNGPAVGAAANGSSSTSSSKVPLTMPVPRMTERNFTMVYFDLETSGLGEGSDINQIAGICRDKEFNRYITPTQRIPEDVTKVTGLSVKRRILYLNDKPLETVSIHNALEAFIDWLRPRKPCLLLAHNAQFDAKHLLHHLKKEDLYKSFSEVVCGFSDTLKIFRELYPRRKGYRQEGLVRDILGKDYAAHNGIYDAKILQELAEFSKVNKEIAIKHSWDCGYWKDLAEYKESIKANQDSLNEFVDQGVLSKYMATKLASNGYNESGLRTASVDNDLDGFTSSLKGVTKRTDILSNLFEALTLDD